MALNEDDAHKASSITKAQQKEYSNSLFRYLTHARVSTCSPPFTSSHYTWKGSAESFVLHWSQHMCAYQKSASAKLSDGLQTGLLAIAVEPIKELRSVRNTALMFEAMDDGKELDYESYLSLVKSAAAAYDDRQNSLRAARHAYDEHDSSSEEETYDIDTPIEYIIRQHEESAAAAYHGQNSLRAAGRRHAYDDEYDSSSEKEKYNIDTPIEYIYRRHEESAAAAYHGEKSPPAAGRRHTYDEYDSSEEEEYNIDTPIEYINRRHEESVAAAYHGQKSPRTAGRRHAYDDEYDSSEEEEYNIDTPIEYILRNNRQRR